MLSRFQTAEDNLVCLGLPGPGLVSIPEMTRRMCKTLMKEMALLVVLGDLLSRKYTLLSIYANLFGNTLTSTKA